MAAFDGVLASRPAPTARVARDVGRSGYATTHDDDAASWQVELVAGPGDELAFVRALRTLARLSLAEALDIHVYACRVPRATLVAGVPFATASRLVCAFAAAGIAAQAGPSSLTTPMLCRPRADEVRDVAFSVPAMRTRPAA